MYKLLILSIVKRNGKEAIQVRHCRMSVWLPPVSKSGLFAPKYCKTSKVPIKYPGKLDILIIAFNALDPYL